VLQAGSTCSVGDDLPATAAKINVPRGLAVDAAGTVYVADVGNHRIRKISAGIITTVAGTGSPGYNLTEDGGPATLAKINRPFDVNVSISGNVYVADTSNHLIRKIDTAGTITTVAGTGTTGSSGDGGPAILAEIDAPHGVAVDSAENVYIADVNTSRVRRIRAGIIETIAGGEIGGFSGDGGPARAAQLNAPRGLDLDPSGTMYVADTGNSRIRRRNLAVQVTIGPDALNLSSNRRWIVATIDFPAGWNAAGVEVDSVRLQAIDPADGALRCSDIPRVLETTRDGEASFTRNDTDGNGTIDQLVLKYERAALDDWITADPALGLRIEGQFPGSPVATTFSGDAVIRVFQSHD